MREHRALRAARRAGRVEDGGEIVARARDLRQFARASLRRARQRCPRRGRRDFRLRAAPSRSASARTSSSSRGPAERQRRAGVVKEIFELGQRIGGVERQQRRAGAKTGEREHDGFRRFVDLRGDPVAGLDAEIDQRLRGPARGGEEFAIAQRAAAFASRSRACRGAARAPAKSQRDWRRSSSVALRPRAATLRLRRAASPAGATTALVASIAAWPSRASAPTRASLERRRGLREERVRWRSRRRKCGRRSSRNAGR